MAGELNHRRPTPIASSAVLDSGASETVAASVKAPKWLLPSIIALLAGGGLGSGVVGIVHANAPQIQVQPLSRTEVQSEASVAAKAEATAVRAEADRQVAETRREMAAAFLQINQRLDKLDAKADQTVGQITELKVDVASLAAKGRR